MVEVNGLRFSTSIGVMFALREREGHTTLQETYASLAKTDMDSVVTITRICCEKGEDKKFESDEAFFETLAEHGVGLVKLSQTYSRLIEALMCSGMSPEEIASAKKQAGKAQEG